MGVELRDDMGRHDLQRILLASKTRVPTPRTASISRRHLIDRARASGARVVSVSAPAGYGKSTMLGEWAATESRAVAWVSLDRTDDDPASLLSVIAAACAAFNPAAEDVISEMRGIGPTSLGRSAPLLAGALAASPKHFVLFIDDVHRAQSPACQDAIEVLLARVPAGSQIVVSSRHEPALLARQRAAGRSWHLSADDLSLDPTAARTIFDHADVAIDDEELRGIVEHCEGWPTGIFLCALVARSGGEAGSVTGEDRYLSDYLYRECLTRLPDALQSFLRRTAVLDQLSAASCDALLDADDSADRLSEIEALNLFLVPIDRDRGWYRFHALFREFLLAEFERAEGADAVADMHARAAVWYEDHGLRVEAVEHLLRGGRSADAARLITELAVPLYQVGQVLTVDRWLEALGERFVRATPPLALFAAWIAILHGRTRTAESWVRIVDEVDTTPFPPEAREVFASSQAMLHSAMCAGGFTQVLVDATFAYQHEPADSAWRSLAVYLYGSALLLAGEAGAAEPVLAEAAAIPTPAHASDRAILAEAELAILAIEERNWPDAAAHSRRGVALIDELHVDGYATTALALAVAARVAFHEGKRAEGDRLLARAMRARVGCTYLLPYLAMRVRLQLAKAHLAIDDRSATNHLMREIDDLLHRCPDVGALADDIEAFRRTLDTHPALGGSVPLTPAELRLLPYLQTHLTVAEIGERLFVSRNTVSSQLGSIYRKLGVTTRGGAVDSAIEAGLLGR